MSKTLEQRFNEKWVENSETGCWDWTASTFPSGYGRIREGGRETNHVGAHRISYKLHVGEIPSGLCVCHRCDRRCCVNPDHLFLGTHEDNMRDMVEKGRALGGGRNPKAKLSQGDIDFVRWALPRWGKGGAAHLAKFFGVSQTQMSRIKYGRAWTDVSLTTEDGK